MTHIGLLAFVIVSLGLLIAHSYFTKGRRLTITFFFFAFVIAVEKELNSFLGSEFPVLQHSSPFFFPSGNPFIYRLVMVIAGWVFVFYLSWYIAEKMIARIRFFKQRIFAILFFTGVVAASISYAIEVTGTGVGWWKWRLLGDTRFSALFVGNAHLFAIEAWFNFTIHFLAAYFLIECSKYRKSSWKMVFFLVYLIRVYTILFFDSSILREIEQYVVLTVLVLLAFFCSLRFDFNEVIYSRISLGNLKVLDKAPLVIIMAMAGVLFFLDIFVLKQPAFLFSLVPLIFCITLAFFHINFSIFLILSIFLLALGKEKMILGVIPVYSIAAFYLFSKFRSFTAIRKE